MSLQEARQFVAHFVTGDYTPEEYAAFLQWLRAATVDELNAIADEHEALHQAWPSPVEGPSSSWITELEGKLDVVSGERGDGVPVRNIGRFPRRNAWVAAASVAFVLSAGGLWYARQHAGQHEKLNISNQDQGLAPLLSQVVSTPRGKGQKQVTLADGSKIWLNAASTLKYPPAFGGSERVVELSGEGFFEVAKNSAMPFRVRIKDAEVAVLGTHLNIMAYENDQVSRTTLIDGSVRLERGSEQKVLQPGQQAVMAYPAPGGVASEIKVETIQDPDKVTAWKDGILQFNSADLTTVMHTVERYYDVDIQFDQGMSGKLFTGGFPRDEKLGRVLKVITGFYTLQYKMDGKSVTVTH